MFDLQQVLDAGVLNGGIAILPAGMMEYAGNAVWPAGLRRLIGSGAGVSVLKRSPGVFGVMLQIPAVLRASIEHLTMAGPGITDELTDSKGILCLGGSDGLDVSYVRLEGWNQCIKTDAGTRLVQIDHCRFDNCGHGILFNPTEAVIVDCEFARWGLARDNGNKYHAIYSAESGSLHVERCRFHDQRHGGYAIHIWGRDGVCKYTRIVNNDFAETVYRGVIPNGSNDTLLSGNTYRCTGEAVSERPAGLVMIGEQFNGHSPGPTQNLSRATWIRSVGCSRNGAEADYSRTKPLTPKFDLQAILNQAAENDTVAVLPAGIHEYNGNVVWPRGLSRLVGAGSGLTILHATGLQNSALPYIKFADNADIGEIIVQGISFEFDGVPNASECLQVSGYSRHLLLRDISILGSWSAALSSQAHDVPLTIDCKDCVFEGYSNVVGFWAGNTPPPEGHKTFRFRRGILRRVGPALNTGDPGNGYPLYIHPQCSMALEDVSIEGHAQYGIHCYGESPTRPPGWDGGRECRRVTFGPDIARGWLTSKYGWSRGVDCWFRGPTALQICEHLELDGCRLEGTCYTFSTRNRRVWLKRCVLAKSIPEVFPAGPAWYDLLIERCQVGMAGTWVERYQLPDLLPQIPGPKGDPGDPGKPGLNGEKGDPGALPLAVTRTGDNITIRHPQAARGVTFSPKKAKLD